MVAPSFVVMDAFGNTSSVFATQIHLPLRGRRLCVIILRFFLCLVAAAQLSFAFPSGEGVTFGDG